MAIGAAGQTLRSKADGMCFLHTERREQAAPNPRRGLGPSPREEPANSTRGGGGQGPGGWLREAAHPSWGQSAVQEHTWRQQPSPPWQTAPFPRSHPSPPHWSRPARVTAATPPVKGSCRGQLWSGMGGQRAPCSAHRRTARERLPLLHNQPLNANHIWPPLQPSCKWFQDHPLSRRSSGQPLGIPPEWLEMRPRRLSFGFLKSLRLAWWPCPPISPLGRICLLEFHPRA